MSNTNDPERKKHISFAGNVKETQKTWIQSDSCWAAPRFVLRSGGAPSVNLSGTPSAESTAESVVSNGMLPTHVSPGCVVECLAIPPTTSSSLHQTALQIDLLFRQLLLADDTPIFLSLHVLLLLLLLHLLVLFSKVVFLVYEVVPSNFSHSVVKNAKWQQKRVIHSGLKTEWSHDHESALFSFSKLDLFAVIKSNWSQWPSGRTSV